VPRKQRKMYKLYLYIQYIYCIYTKLYIFFYVKKMHFFMLSKFKVYYT